MTAAIWAAWGATTLVVGWAAAAAWLDAHGRRARPRGRYDAIVVAGCAVRRGGAPSTALRRRATLAATLFHEGIAPRIVLTGGVGLHPPSEARVAADVCRALGVPDDALTLEEASTTTEENARLAREVVGPGRVLAVSDCYHAFRCARLFRRHFGDADAVGGTPEGSQRIRMALREVGAVVSYALRGRL